MDQRLAQVLPTSLPADSPATIKHIERVFGNIVFIALGAAGIALFIMVIIGGFKWATAGENPEKAAAARKTLTAAIIGLVLVVLSYLILVVIAEFTGNFGLLIFDVDN